MGEYAVSVCIGITHVPESVLSTAFVWVMTLEKNGKKVEFENKIPVPANTTVAVQQRHTCNGCVQPCEHEGCRVDADIEQLMPDSTTTACTFAIAVP